MKLKNLICLVLFIYSTVAFSGDVNLAKMHQAHKVKYSNVGLTEAGNDVFGTIQEVITKLNGDPNTDWKKVNIEALRQHLLDMNDMTLNVEVVSQKAIRNGLKATVRPTTVRAALALKRVLKAHPAQLKRETGWNMKILKINEKYIITTTSKRPKDASKIRGLGYIGLMAYGKHHQLHHWAMSTGKNPHGAHH